jgi:hypothetical protein
VNEQTIDRKTAAFYLTLLALVLLDLVLVLWIFNPFTHFGTSAYASQKVPSVSDSTKPSPFEIADSKRTVVLGVRRRAKPATASTDASR